MYTIQVKVTKAPFYNGEDFLIYTESKEGKYIPLTKQEADTLLEIFKNYPSIFHDPFIRALDFEDVVLIHPEDDTKYNVPLDFEFNYVLEDLSAGDTQKLRSIAGHLSGFNQQYVALKT